MFSALLDTCVLVPSRARDVLLEIASTGAFRPLWSSEVLAEFDRTLRRLLGKRGVSPEEIEAYLTRLFRQMETAFPDARVTEWESLVETIQLPDPDDRHVVAAARAGRADVIVTDNLGHFPPAALPAPLMRQSLDDFLLDSLDLHPELVVSAVHAVAGRTGRTGPAMTAHDVAIYLRHMTSLLSANACSPNLPKQIPGGMARHRPDGDRSLPRHADRPAPGSHTRPRVRRLRERGVSSAGIENLS